MTGDLLVELGQHFADRNLLLVTFWGGKLLISEDF